MTLNIEHRLFVKKNDKKWIYFGASYLKLYLLERKINKMNRISLSEKNYSNFIKEKKIFKEWLERQRVFFNDSIYWWMNGLASRSNLSSNFLLNISQISSIKDYLRDNKKNENITIISENFHLIKFLIENFEKEYTLKVPKFLPIFLFIEKIYLVFQGLINYLKIIYYFITHYLFSFQTKPKKKNPKGEVYLFHDLINSSDFKEGSVQSRYFGVYPRWLEKNGKQVISLPWFYQNLTNKREIYQNLRSRNSFIPEDWLNIFNYFQSLKYSFKSSFTINEKIYYPNIKVLNLIKIAKLSALQNKSAIFFRYMMALKRWSKNINSLIFIDHYQNQSYEHPIRYELKNLKISKLQSIGYYHSLHSNNFLPYMSDKKEWESKVKPDLIICPNEICKEHLKSQGIPTNKLKVISDLQREQLFKKSNLKKQFNKNLLIMLSLFPESNYEILLKFSKINDYLTNELGLNIKIRPHPYINIDEIKKKLKWKTFPNKWTVSNDDLQTDLNDSYCVVTMHSSAITDAIHFDCIALILKTEFNVAENFLDFIENKFPILAATKDNNLKEKLTEIYSTKKDYYKKEFINIREFMETNISEVAYQKIVD